MVSGALWCWRNYTSKRYCLTAENVFELGGRQLMTTPTLKVVMGHKQSIFIHIKLEHQGDPRLFQHGLSTQTLRNHA